MMNLYVFDSDIRFNNSEPVGNAIRAARHALGYDINSMAIYIVPYKQTQTSGTFVIETEKVPRWENDDILFMHNLDVHNSNVIVDSENLTLASLLMAPIGPKIVLFSGAGITEDDINSHASRVFGISPWISNTARITIWINFLTHIFYNDNNAVLGIKERLLVESAIYPEILVAGYLLLIAKSKDDNIPLDMLSEEQWEDAGDEYKYIKTGKHCSEINWRACARSTAEQQKNIRICLKNYFSDMAARL